MTASSVRTPHACLERAVQFKHDAQELGRLPNQLYAVSDFYAAFHTFRASLMTASVFDDVPRLKSIDLNWLPEDRWNDHHQARRGNGQVAAPGVTDLVEKLYPRIAVDYVLLHSASVAVRYGLGLGGYDSLDLAEAFDVIVKAANDGQLVAR